MHEPSLGEFQGIPALERLAAEVGDWPETVQDPEWCARFLFQVIERRGTGGGNFRLMYSRFLEEAGRDEAELAAEAARAVDLARGRRPRGKRGGRGDSSHWAALTAETERVLEAERRLWDALRPSGLGERLREAGEEAERVAGAALELQAGRRGPQPHRLSAT